MTAAPSDDRFMSRALELAEQGRGAVEPNPMVGCVIVRDGEIVGEGFHQRFGGPHAEIEALQSLESFPKTGERASARGATVTSARGAAAYVTLEPCCHQGKTGPCTTALIDAGVARVIVGCQDPNPQVAGQGVAALQAAGIDVVESSLQTEAKQLIAPFTKLLSIGRPWVIAKWAMTLDGKLATHTGSSQWISGESSRAVVHRLRGQVDAILVGRGTAEADDPLLTARPPGPRTATRIVLDSNGVLSSKSKLVQSVADTPLLVATTETATATNRQRLEASGAEVLMLASETRSEQMAELLDELGRRQMTNLLVEGGSEVLGTLLDMQAIDEVHAFVAPKLIGGVKAPSPIAGTGIESMTTAIQLERMQIEALGNDIHVHGFLE